MTTIINNAGGLRGRFSHDTGIDSNKVEVSRRYRSVSAVLNLCRDLNAWVVDNWTSFCNRFAVQVSYYILGGRYPAGSMEAMAMGSWRTCYKDFKSPKTQQLLKEVKDTYGPSTLFVGPLFLLLPRYTRKMLPVDEVVNKIFDGINFFMNEVEKKDARHGLTPLLFDNIYVMSNMCNMPEEILRQLKENPDGNGRHIRTDTLRQTLFFVNNLNKLTWVSCNGNSEAAMIGLSIAIVVQTIASIVDLQDVPIAGKHYVRQNGALMLDQLILQMNMRFGGTTRGLLGLESFFCKGCKHLLSTNKNSVNMIIPSNNRAVLENYGVPKTCPDIEIIWVFLLKTLTKSGIFGCQQGQNFETEPADIALGIIQALTTGSIDSLAEEYFASPGFKDNFC